MPEIIRILFITNTPPIPTQGGAMTFYRHFIESGDFKVAVITDERQIINYELPYSYLLVNTGKFGKRISNTRLFAYVQTFRRLIGVFGLNANILRYSVRFKPDVIFTVAGSWNWMAIIAQKVAKRLNVPLIGSFNDWWSYSSAYLPKFSGLIERRFKAFYKKCNLAICTSEGMYEALGAHNNHIILYPTGAKMNINASFIPATKDFTIAFAGNLGDWYGKMLEALIVENQYENIHFKIYGFNQNWGEVFNEKVIKEGIYKGKVSFEVLKEEVQNCNALLLLMGFDKENAIIEKTSFKTKFLDYLSFKKPVILWGPDYCSAVKVASEFDSAEIIEENEPNEVLERIIGLIDNPQRQMELIKNGRKMYEERFDPEKLHALLKTSIESLVANHA